MRQDTDHLIFRRFDRLNLYNSLILHHRLVDMDRQARLYEAATDSAESFDKLVKLVDEARPLLTEYRKFNSKRSVIGQ